MASFLGSRMLGIPRDKGKATAPCPLLKDLSGRNPLPSVTGKMLIENLWHARNTAVTIANKANSSPRATLNGRKRQEKNVIISDTSNTEKHLDLRMPEGRRGLGDYFSRMVKKACLRRSYFKQRSGRMIWQRKQLTQRTWGGSAKSF